MAGKHSVEGEVELNNCSPHKFLEMFKGKQEHIPNICSHSVTGIEAQHDDWTTVGTTTRRWDYIHQGKSRYLTERIESVDEENNTIVLEMVDGDIMKMYYRKFVSTIRAIPKEQGCLIKWRIEYEKLKEDAPEPHAELEFVLAMAKDLGDHHITNH